MLERLRRHFFVGVFTIAPFALTLYVLILLGSWFDALFQPIIHIILKPYFVRPIPGLGIAIGLIFIVFVGIAAPSFLGKQIVNLTECVVERIPLVKIIYSAARQIFDAFSQSNSDKFRRVVMVPFPKEGCWAMAFVTQEVDQGWVPGEASTKLAIFVPTTPNPTSGYLMFVSIEEVVPLNITVEEGLKLVISAGLTKPTYLENISKNLTT